MNKEFVNFSESSNCPVRNILDRIGDKWSLLILMVLEQQEVLRFNEIHQAIGDISQKMLSVSLKNLEADGLVNRKVYPQIPPKVEYRLTDLGKSLIPYVDALSDWSKQHMATILKNRETYQKKL
ncbi:helix-turn-helix transcriptional regulator [Mangrovimonas sp. AS39]|uniref:winged helix-turn-helix transcriptional regulator n=1 Tax=Mangrovimonas futianensis TaxID=2895523 RepID=UPI001E2DE5B4|nr:helix-turn-helix domain-containing protein [Mangrovimonas futianensis]MCF1191546.1 helix-turn-helix transcriptional regulator [Mangrovimonas futianensis]MCF1195566.1 helix-turn-helix transcriptional regulator [Mangrovimonas futianensis]